MAEKIIKVASFPYAGPNGVERTAVRGDTVDVPDDADVQRGERLDAFATDEDLKAGTVFGDFYSALQQRQQPNAEPIATQPEPPAPVGPEQPGKNDSREKWADYARAKGASEDEVVAVDQGGLTRDRLREKYGA